MTLEAFRSERSSQKRNSILAAGLDLFRRQGFAETPMEQIARLAEVSTATLYRHFRSKEALFAAVALDGLMRIEADGGVSAVSPEQRLDGLARAYARFLCEPHTRGLMRMLISETSRNPDLAERFYASVKAQLSDMFAEAVQAGVEAGLFQDHNNPSYVAGQLQGMIEHGTLLLGLIRGDDAPPGLPPDQIAKDALTTWKARWSAHG